MRKGCCCCPEAWSMHRGMPPDGDEEVLSEVVTATTEDGAEGDRDKATSQFDSMSWYG